jgi:hypothetical protein
MCNEALATTQCLICRRVGISAADRTRLTSGRPRSTTTTATLPAGHVLELRYGCMRISATSARVHRSVVADLCPGYRRCRPRPRCRYPSSRPSGYRGSRASRWDRARGTEYRASWTSTPTSRWRWRWASRWATLGRAVPRPGRSRREQLTLSPTAKDEFDSLFTTDVLAEGMNLQQAGQDTRTASTPKSRRSPGRPTETGIGPRKRSGFDRRATARHPCGRQQVARPRTSAWLPQGRRPWR